MEKKKFVHVITITKNNIVPNLTDLRLEIMNYILNDNVINILVYINSAMARNHGHLHFSGFMLPRASTQQWLRNALCLLSGELSIFNIACYI